METFSNNKVTDRSKVNVRKFFISLDFFYEFHKFPTKKMEVHTIFGAVKIIILGLIRIPIHTHL